MRDGSLHEFMTCPSRESDRELEQRSTFKEVGHQLLSLSSVAECIDVLREHGGRPRGLLASGTDALVEGRQVAQPFSRSFVIGGGELNVHCARREHYARPETIELGQRGFPDLEGGRTSRTLGG